MQFATPKIVLNEVARIHPELTNMVIPILESLEKSRQLEQDRDTAARSRHLEMSEANVDLKTLNDFLLRYAPLQLLTDRQSSKKLFLNRRILLACCCMQAATDLFKRAKAAEGENLSSNMQKLLTVDSRAALPHPLWTLKHDATLVIAIAKHGWIDSDKSRRDITADPEINWGEPFSLTKDNENDMPVKKELPEDELASLKSTASRAAKFLNDYHALLEEVKGCNQNLIVESYGLKREPVGGDSSDGNSSMQWVVDDDLLLQAATGKNPGKDSEEGANREPLDLPMKKDLSKRAKTVILKSIYILESGVTPASRTTETAPDPNEAALTNDYGYTVVDQSDKCCILLAEMVRVILKASPWNPP